MRPAVLAFVVPETPTGRIQLRAWCHRPRKKHVLVKVIATWSGWVVEVSEEVASRSGSRATWSRYDETSCTYCTAFCEHDRKAFPAVPIGDLIAAARIGVENVVLLPEGMWLDPCGVLSRRNVVPG
jgi:hypothetical protein